MSQPADSSADSALSAIALEIDDAQIALLIDGYCSSLSEGSRLAYQEAFAAQQAQGADGVSARQAALYQAIAHQAIENALSEAVSKRAAGAGQNR